MAHGAYRALQKILAITLPPLAYAAPLVAYAAPRTFAELASLTVFYINNVVAVLIVLGLVLYFWGVTTNLNKLGSDAEARKNMLLWGVIALFVMVSVWGILRLLQATLFGGGGGAPGSSTSSGICDSFGNCGQ